MYTQKLVNRTERSDDIPLLLAQMRKIGLSELIDAHFHTHGNWKGLSIGQVIVGWLCYLLSEGDHRLNHVETWANRLLVTLGARLETNVRALDFSDDRLALVLDYLSHDQAWENFERSLNGSILRVYNLKPEKVRIDTTTAKSYVAVDEGGLFQFGHSKDHRPDLPQVKISQSALDPLGIPVTTTVVRGNCADDPLYIPEIKRVQSAPETPGLLHIGDCKMSSLETRAYVAFSGDHYLCPLSAVQVPQQEMTRLLRPIWLHEQQVSTVFRPQTKKEIKQKEEPEDLAEGFTYEETMEAEISGKTIKWLEHRHVVRSFKHFERQQQALDARLKKAQAALAKLNLRGRGRKVRQGEELTETVDKILARHRVTGILTVTYETETQVIHKRAYRDRPARTEEKRETFVNSEIDPVTYNDTVRCLGWRVYASNDPALDMNEAVSAYREEYLVERGFGRYKGKVLGLAPLHLCSDGRIKGLIRLLSIGLRILCLLEFTARTALNDRGEVLAGIYKGNPKRFTQRPTAELILKAFEWITLTELHIDGKTHRCLSPLSEVQQRILELLGFPDTVYTALSG